MGEGRFDDRIAEAQSRVEQLRRRTMESAGDAEGLLSQAFEELQATLEELQVAEEELQQQSEELTGSREAEALERQRYRELFEFAPDGYLLTDAQASVRECNRAGALLLGIGQTTIVGKPLTFFVQENDHPDFFDVLRRLRSGETVSGCRVQIQPRGRACFPAALDATPALDVTGRTLGLRWILRDVTEQERAEEQLRLRNRAVESVSDGVVIADAMLPECPITYCNAAFETITGYSKDEVIGRNCRFLQGPDTDPAAREEIRAAVFEHRSCRVTLKNYRKDGTAFWNELSVSPVRDNQGQVTHFVAIVNDVTERRRVEQEARSHLAELAHANRLAVMGEMVYGIAHELNQPLAAIVSFGEACTYTLESGRDSRDEMTEALQQVVAQGQRAGEIVRRLRQFVKKGEVERSRLDLNDAVRDVLALVAQEISDRSVNVKLILSDPLPQVSVDTIQIEQVILNLIRNAIDSMEDRERAERGLTIQTMHRNGDGIEVAVGDTGTGLPTESVDQVFETFYSTKSSGMGMGLSISRSIIHAHGGKLWATPNPDRGATFRFTLPSE